MLTVSAGRGQVFTFTYMQPALCSTTTPADCVAPLGACSITTAGVEALSLAKPPSSSMCALPVNGVPTHKHETELCTSATEGVELSGEDIPKASPEKAQMRMWWSHCSTHCSLKSFHNKGLQYLPQHRLNG